MASDKSEADIRRDICRVSDDLTEVDTAIQNWLTSNMDTGTYTIDGTMVTYTTAKGYASAISMGANALPTYDSNNNNQILAVRSGIAVWRYTPLFTMANTGFNDGANAGHFPTAQAGKYFRLIENTTDDRAEIHTRWLPDFTGLGFDGSMSAALTGATEGNNVIIASDGANLRLSHEAPVLSFNRLLTGSHRLLTSTTDTDLNGLLLTVAGDGQNLELVARSSVVTGSGGSANIPTGFSGQLLGYDLASTETTGTTNLKPVTQPLFSEAGFNHDNSNVGFPLTATINSVANTSLANRIFSLREVSINVAGVATQANVISSIHRVDLFNSILDTNKLIVPPETSGTNIAGKNSLLVVNQAQNGLTDVAVGTAGQVLTVGATPDTDPLTWTSLPTFPDFTGLATLVAHQNVVVGTGGNLAVESFTASFNRILNNALVLPTAADATTNEGMLLTVDNTGKKFNFTAPSMLMAQSQLPTVTSQEHKHLAVYNTDPGGSDTLSSRWEYVPNWSHLGFNPAGTIREFPETAIITNVSVDTSTAVNLSGLMVGFRAGGSSDSILSAYRITDLFNTLLPATKQFQHAVGAQVANASLATHNNLLLINSTRTGFVEATRRDIINHSLQTTSQLNQDGTTTHAANIAKAGYLMQVNGSHQRLEQISKRDTFNDALAGTSKLQRDVETGFDASAQLNTNEVAAAGSLMRVTSDQRNLEAITPRFAFNQSLSTAHQLRLDTDVTTTTNILRAGSLLQADTNRQRLEGITKRGVLNASLETSSQLQEESTVTPQLADGVVAPAGALLEVNSTRRKLAHTTLRDKLNSEIFGTTSDNQLNTANAGMFLVIENEAIGMTNEARIGLVDAPTGGGGSATIRFHGIRKTLNRVELVSGTDSFDVDQYDDYFLAPMGTTVNNVSGRIRIDLPA